MNQKIYNKIIIVLPVFVVGLLGLFLYVLSITGAPKPLATAEQVWSILESQGYEPTDTTQLYRHGWNDINSKIVQVVSIKDDDLGFDFFTFDSKETAEYVRGYCQSYIRWNRYTVPNVEIKNAATNHMIYTLKAGGMYSVNIRVENTLIFAYSDEENASKIDDIVRAIGYF